MSSSSLGPRAHPAKVLTITSFGLMRAGRPRSRAGPRSQAGMLVAIFSVGLLLTGCRRDMHDQPRLKPYVAEAQRLPPEGTFPHRKSDMAAPLSTPKEG